MEIKLDKKEKELLKDLLGIFDKYGVDSMDKQIEESKLSQAAKEWYKRQKENYKIYHKIK